MSTFSAQINAWIEKTKDDADKIVRYALQTLDGRLVNRSPVGDPATWKVNPNAPKIFGKFGATGPKANWQSGFMSSKSSTYSMSGAGYVGGRFKGNWQVSIGSPETGVLDVEDKDGRATMAAHAGIIAIAKAGEIQYLVNNLPYAKRIEEGWSKQAPVGVVLLAVVEWNNIVENAVNGVKAGGGDMAAGFGAYPL